MYEQNAKLRNDKRTIMTIDQINKINKILEKLTRVDSRITEIENAAKIVVEGTVNSKMALKIKANIKQEEEKKIFDEDGSLKIKTISDFSDMLQRRFQLPPSHPLFANWSPLDSSNILSEKSKYDIELEPNITDSTTLKILGILLQEAMDEKIRLQNKLNRLGVKV